MPKLVKLHTVHNDVILINPDHIMYITSSGPVTKNTCIKLVSGDDIVVDETLDTVSDMISAKRKYIG